MASWNAFAAADPDLAAFGYECLHRRGDGIGYLATVRHDDGGPRMHPVCVTLVMGVLHVAIPRRSPKNADIRADPRFMLHAWPADADAEFSIRGTAELVTDQARRQAVADAAAMATGVQDHEDVFVLDIERADATTWEQWNTPQTRPVRRRWIA